MTDAGREMLRRVFELGYDDLRTRLANRVGSSEIASDALHETWLQINRSAPASPVRSPMGYIFRIAMNIVLKRWQVENRLVTLSDAKMAVGIADDTPNPEQTTVARLEMDALVRAISELTPRRRKILLAIRLDGQSLLETATQLAVSQRLVEIELKHALEHCAYRLGRDVIQRFGPKSKPDTRPRVLPLGSLTGRKQNNER
jgi:RNA polymerase sigma-70 factor (ECF subfamily)